MNLNIVTPGSELSLLIGIAQPYAKSRYMVPVYNVKYRLNRCHFEHCDTLKYIKQDTQYMYSLIYACYYMSLLFGQSLLDLTLFSM